MPGSASDAAGSDEGIREATRGPGFEKEKKEKLKFRNVKFLKKNINSVVLWQR